MLSHKTLYYLVDETRGNLVHMIHPGLFKLTQTDVASAHPQMNIANSDGSRGWEDQSTGNH